MVSLYRLVRCSASFDMKEVDQMRRLWLVRLGKNGEFERLALDKGILRIGFGVESEVSNLKDRAGLLRLMESIFPDARPAKQRNFASQVNQFVNIAAGGDLVVSPMKTTSTIAIGRLSGPYAPGPMREVTRPVEWLRVDIKRDAFKQDLLYSFGAIMTVCEISRNDALNRVEQVLKTGIDPGDGLAPKRPGVPGEKPGDDAEERSDYLVNLDQIARDQIEKRIASEFTGHGFTQLVAAILRAQGYRTRVSPPGADQGVDIVAGSGPLGLESPRIVVQVKSGNVTVDQPTLQGLIGSVQDTQADHGLIVSWNGYTSAVRRRVNELFFRVRLWGREELVDNLLATYGDLPEDITAELPLRRIWTLVLDDHGSD